LSKPILEGRVEFHPRYRVFPGPGSLNLVFLKTKSQRKGRGAGFDPWKGFLDQCSALAKFSFYFPFVARVELVFSPGYGGYMYMKNKTQKLIYIYIYIYKDQEQPPPIGQHLEW
jgi:hypothetical protein